MHSLGINGKQNTGSWLTQVHLKKNGYQNGVCVCVCVHLILAK